MADSDLIIAYLADNTTNKFQDRVKYFWQKQALAVMWEADTVNYHSQRVDFAGLILSGTFPVFELALATSTNAAISAAIVAGSEPADADIQTAATGMWNPFALSVV